MTFWSALKLFAIVLLAANFIGLLIRSKQEHLITPLRVAAIFIFPIYMLFVIVSPGIVAVQMYRGKIGDYAKFNRFVRVLFGIMSVPVTYIIVIGNFSEMTDEVVWKGLKVASRTVKMKQRSILKVNKKSKVRPPVRYSATFGNILNSLNETTSLIGNRVQNSAFMARPSA